MGGSCPVRMPSGPCSNPLPTDVLEVAQCACSDGFSIILPTFVAQGYISNFLTTPIMLLVPVVGVICDVIPVVRNTCSSNCNRQRPEHLWKVQIAQTPL